MAALTKAQKKQQAQGLLTQFISDNVLTTDEIKQLKKLDKSVLADYKTGLLDKAKAGDSNTLQMLGASDLSFSKSIFNDKALKGTDAGNMGAALLKSAAKDKPIDFGSMSDAQAALAANIYMGSGDSALIDPRWAAEVSGQNVYKDAAGNYQLTGVGKNSFQSGLANASDLAQYQKDFYADNVSKNFYNADGSLNDAGQQQFNDFWMQSGVTNRDQALDAFQQQINPNYQSTQPAATQNNANAMPTNMNDLNQWSATNMMGQTVAPLSQQNLSALQQQADIAQGNIAAGDRNAPMRDLMMSYATTGATGNMAPSAAAQTNMSQLAKAGVNNAAISQIDLNQLAKAGVNNAAISQIDLNQLRNATAREAQASLIDAKSNPYLGQNTGDIAFNDKNRYLGTDNPYLQAMVDYSTADITRNFNNNVQNSTDAMMARAGAFGGSAWQEAQAENSRQLANELGRAVTGLRSADYESQKQLEESNLNRMLSTQVQNQNVRASDLARNAALQSQYDTYNTTAQNNMAQFNAGQANQMSLANAGAYNSALAANMAASNAGNQFNASQANQISLANAGAYNSALAANMAASNAGNQFNASQANQLALANANAYNNALQNNTNLLNQNNQFNSSLQLQYDQLANQARLQAAGLYGNLGDTRYGDIQQLSNVGDAYRNYSQSLINENLNNWNAQQNWAQQQNDKLGGAISSMGSLQNTQTSTNPYTQPQNNNWQSLAGLGLSAASMIGGWGSGTGAAGAAASPGANGGTFDINKSLSNMGSAFPSLNWG
jgi:hypothetical protein